MDQNITIQEIKESNDTNVRVSTLRLDAMHPIVSGNKWFKLRYYIQEALNKKATCVASFGGPYSNHLVALAYTAKQNELKSIGYVRSNSEEPLTPTLQEAIEYGMDLQFLGRQHFKTQKENLLSTYYRGQNEDTINTDTYLINSASYFIDEGGYGYLGAKGAATILDNVPLASYDYIICAVGTGTMMAGLINSASPNQKIIGIPVLKNEESIEKEIRSLLSNPAAPFTLFHEFHHGGYAKTNQSLFDFMNELWIKENIPTDIVYTGKLFMAVEHLLKNNYFSPESSLLVIHSGGLQGNRSLPKNILLY